MSSKEKLQLLASRLLEAEKNRAGIGPLTEECPDLTVKEAYQIQMRILKAKLGGPNRSVGKKIGLTSVAMQQMLGVFEPDFGYLLNTMEAAEGGIISCSELMQPKVEPEIAFLLNNDLAGPGVSLADVLRATEAVMPALEIPDTRIRDWKIKIQDTVADSASGGRYVLGRRLTRLQDFDLRLIGMVFKRNGEILSTGAGAAVLGHPAAAVAWLANKLAEFDTYLRAGEVIIPGAICGAVNAAAGDYFEAEFDRLGSVSIRFGA